MSVFRMKNELCTQRYRSESENRKSCLIIHACAEGQLNPQETATSSQRLPVTVEKSAYHHQISVCLPASDHRIMMHISS